jgi:demethylmenaquinone methyltransferase/2-methoxy-6-polyprenyl-1,4-benzoquinol methylase
MSKAIHDMFETIVHRYDLTNDILSLGIHRLWRSRALKLANIQPGETACDVCTGTGEVAFALKNLVGESGSVVGCDFVQQMVRVGNAKNNATEKNVLFVHGDALSLPIASNSCDVLTIAYGIRNVDAPVEALKEFRRVLKSTGRLVVIEFGQPTLPIFSTFYKCYSKYIMPLIGGLLTGNSAAYRYLPRTASEFPAGNKFLALMNEAGFTKSQAVPLTMEIAYIYLGIK